MTFIPFDDLDDAFESMRKNEEEANANLLPAQGNVVWGSYWVRPYDDILVFGYVFTPEENISSEVEAGSTPEELKYTVKRLRESYTRGYRYGRCHSILCPEGELGDTHLSQVLPVTAEVFETGRRQGWQLDRGQYLQVLKDAELA